MGPAPRSGGATELEKQEATANLPAYQLKMLADVLRQRDSCKKIKPIEKRSIALTGLLGANQRGSGAMSVLRLAPWPMQAH